MISSVPELRSLRSLLYVHRSPFSIGFGYLIFIPCLLRHCSLRDDASHASLLLRIRLASSSLSPLRRRSSSYHSQTHRTILKPRHPHMYAVVRILYYPPSHSLPTTFSFPHIFVCHSLHESLHCSVLIVFRTTQRYKMIPLVHVLVPLCR